jgi:hypothetical protein
MLIRIIALHSPNTSSGYTNKILEGDIAQTNLFRSTATYMGTKNKVKLRLRATRKPATARPTTFHVCKPGAAVAVLGS